MVQLNGVKVKALSVYLRVTITQGKTQLCFLETLMRCGLHIVSFDRQSRYFLSSVDI